MQPRRLGTPVCVTAFLLAVAVAPAAGARPPEPRPGGPEPNLLLAGSAAENITPFTVEHPKAVAADPLSNPNASNPDGAPDALWDTFEPEPGFISAGQVTASGLWGETFTDENGNGRFDAGEPFVDDPVNTRLDPDSAGKWDGIYLAGFGANRIPRGVFDPIWARAVYLKGEGGPAIAQVSIDVLGWFSDWNDRVVSLVRQLDPALELDHLIVTHTHDHESVDTHVGIWGQDVAHDGTYPKYERYIEWKLAQAVVTAGQAARPAGVKYGAIAPGEPFTTTRGNVEDLEGMQSRNSCRTPWVFDDEVRVMQVIEADGPGTIATLVNWGTHVESLEGDNLYLSSDFVHTVRETVEEAFGGVALFLPGAQGAAEIVGDSCTQRWQRTTFDGESYRVDAGGEPEVLNDINANPLGARDRTYAIGRVAGNAAVAAVAGAAVDTTATRISELEARELFVPVNNQGLAALSAIGVIDKPAYVNGVSVSRETLGRLGSFASPTSGFDAKTTVYAWRLGTASFVTAPGELFPEIYFGLSTHHRGKSGGQADHFDYENPNPAALACSEQPFSYEAPPGAATGRPFEPGVREAQVEHYRTEHNFLIGYTPDLLGYIVPGYDFSWFAAPPAEGVGLGALHGVVGDDQAPDPCAELPPDLNFAGARYGSHYQETNSAGSMLAPAYACSVWEMLELDPDDSAEGGAACDEWDAWKAAGVAHVGVDPSTCDPTSNTDCVRHY